MCKNVCIYLQMHEYMICIYVYYLLIQNSMHLFSKLFLRLRDIIDRSATVITGFVPRFYAITEIE